MLFGISDAHATEHPIHVVPVGLECYFHDRVLFLSLCSNFGFRRDPFREEVLVSSYSCALTRPALAGDPFSLQQEAGREQL